MFLVKLSEKNFQLVKGKKYYLAAAIVFVFCSCGEAKYKFKDFSNADPKKEESDFKKESSLCQAEKDKFSNKIEGRKFGFKGSNTGYLGCMKIKGWVFNGNT